MSDTLRQFMKETYKYDFISKDKEKNLSERIKRGDKKAREDLIHSHMRMVFNIAKRFNKQHFIDLEDLIQEGNLGLVIAADNFNPTKNVRFANYAKFWITEFIKRKFYKELYIVEAPLRVVKKTFQMSLGKKELEKEKKKGENKAIKKMVLKPAYLSDGLSIKNTHGKEIPLSETLADTRESFEEDIERDDIRRFLSRRVKYYLSREETLVIRKRYLNPKYKFTYKHLGVSLEVSSETVRNIERRAIRKLQKTMKKELSYI